RPEVSGKTAFFPRNDRPCGLKRAAFQTEIFYEGEASFWGASPLRIPFFPQKRLSRLRQAPAPCPFPRAGEQLSRRPNGFPSLQSLKVKGRFYFFRVIKSINYLKKCSFYY
ncbi:hypothetical protein, partial [uncultured Desulfovibrio sp.]|uniref:hypothetical protein n=1 Tax=uncultured Desulfovibrio sp. TaxID=167968 RepID=UPI00260E9972